MSASAGTVTAKATGITYAVDIALDDDGQFVDAESDAVSPSTTAE